MFLCEKCTASFTCKRSLDRHTRSVHGNVKFNCNFCGKEFARRDILIRHQRKFNHDEPGVNLNPTRGTSPQPGPSHRITPPNSPVKRAASPTLVGIPKKRRVQNDPDNLLSQDDEGLNTFMEKWEDEQKEYELSSQDDVGINEFMDNWEVQQDPPEVNNEPEIEEINALEDAIFSARLTAPEGVTDPVLFLNEHRDKLQTYLRNKLLEQRGIKWYMVVRARYTRELGNTGTDVETSPYFRGFTHATLTPEVIPRQQDLSREKIAESMNSFESMGSGWVLDRILYVQINIIQYLPLVGGTYFQLPPIIENKKATVNVDPEDPLDNKCFLWSILAKLHPATNHPSRITHYRPYEDELNVSGITFPFELDSYKLKTFEEKNNLSINIFAYEKGYFPRYVSEKKVPEARQIDLLLVSNGESKHYVLIRHLSRLLSEFTKHNGRDYYCRYCLKRSNMEEVHNNHVRECNVHDPQRVIMPHDEPILKFSNFGWTQMVPYIIVADFESLLPKVSTCLPDSSLSSTTTLALHVACGFSYAIVGPTGNLVKHETYRGGDGALKFLKMLLGEADDIAEMLKENIPMQLSVDEEIAFQTSTRCYVCEESFIGEMVKTRDHDHYTGVYRGCACQSCNLKLKAPKFIPVVMHNLSRYDAHLIMQQIALIRNKKIDCIASNSETYISFTLGNLRFVDSIRFLPASLETLVSNVAKGGPAKFPLLNSVFNPDEVKLLLRKGVYPYTYMDSEKRFDERQLPQIECFHNDLTDEPLAQEDYAHAQNVWQSFNIQNLGGYHDLYVLSDTLLLADVFHNFRKMCMTSYRLDPAHAYTLPGFAWSAALCKTKVRLDLLLDEDMHLFIEKGIRGGVSMISHRFAAANNKYLESHDESKPSSFICYLDCNNLYGTVMCDALPVKNFRWIEPTPNSETEILRCSDTSPEGFIVEVDLEYPEDLHNDHNSYPLAPESMTIKPEMLSEYSKDQMTSLNIKIKESLPKLVPNLFNKERYVVHYRNLKYYVSKGLKITKIHRILKFEQGAWLKEYINFNTEKRKLATDDFEKDLYKLMNNAVFGKTMENLRNRQDFKLVTTPEKAVKKASSPAFEKFTIFHNELVGIHMTKKKLVLNRPIYTGFVILDLSKLLMYQFHYDVIQRRYGERAKLLFTDTDSLTYCIETPDLYADFAAQADMYDFSGYPRDHPLFSDANKKKLGKFKDELDGTPIEQFCGLRPKMYSILSAKGEKKTCKGVCKRVVKKNVRHEQYRDCLFNRELTVAEMTRIVSNKHVLSTVRQNKLCLNPCDDKRFILDDGVSTLAHGHKDTK